MIRYSIKDLEKLTGIKAHTIRIWEKRYQVVEPARTTTNIRYYSDEDLKRLLSVSLLNRYGYRISNIVSMSPEEMTSTLMELAQSDDQFSHEVETLVISMIEMDEPRFDHILSSAIIKYGFEHTITDLLHRFLEKIGLLWQTGTITPAQEHFVSNLIRQKLIMAIDGQQSPIRENAKTFLLFLPEEEYHEIGLLYFNYLIRKHGHHVIYLGQNVPIANLPEILDIRPFDCLLTSLTCSIHEQSLQVVLNRLHTLFPDKTVLVGGSLFESEEYNLYNNMIYLRNTESLIDFLSKI